MARETLVADETQQEGAWKQVDRHEGSGENILTGGGLGSADNEMARNWALLKGLSVPKSDAEQRRALRAPDAQPAEREPADETIPRVARQAVAPELGPTIYEPPEPRPTRARPPVTEAAPVAEEQVPSVTPEDREGIELERRILGGPNVLADDSIDGGTVKIGGRDIPLSRVIEGDRALREREQWERKLKQQQQSMAEAWRTVAAETAQGFVKDPVGRLRQLGMNDQDIAQHFAQAGLSPGAGAVRHEQVTSLPEDADPLAKALFEENRQFKQTIQRLDGEIRGIRNETLEERQRRSDQANEAARLATLSGVKSELIASASKMPSMRDANGKLLPIAAEMVDTTSLLLDRELQRGQIPDHEAVRQRAFELFGARARERGITPKAEQARNAIERRRTPLPSRPGTTVSGAAAANRQINPRAIDFSDDDARKAGMRAWAAQFEADLQAG